MNEITQIHLGRQAFTIAGNAHKELQEYLHAIEKEVGKKGEEVVKEVENRMAELLTERGIVGEKVVLLEDVEFLKQQLGSPKDFNDKEEEDDAPEPPEEQQASKRLFRDTDRGIIAGVAAGLARYLTIDPIFVRAGFAILTLFWGWGILVYILLWLIVPEAKSSSNRLQMEGKAVTVQSLKDAVHKVDVPGAANRASRTIGRVLEKLGKALLVVIGVGILLFGCALFLVPASVGTYLLTNGAEAFGEVIFPVGATETWLVICGIIAAAAISILCMLVGLAMIRRKWPLPGWAVAAMIGVILASTSLGLGLGFDAAPDLAKRVDALKHTQEVKTPAFKKVALTGHQARFSYVPSNSYSVDLHYFGKEKHETSSVVKIDGETLHIDAAPMLEKNDCWIICFGDERWAEVVIHAPTLEAVKLDGIISFTSDKVLGANATITVGSSADVSLMGQYTDKVEIEILESSPVTTLKLTGSRGSGADQGVYISSGRVNLGQTGALKLKTSYECLWSMPAVQLNLMPNHITINDEAPVTTQADLEKRQVQDRGDIYNCVGINPIVYY